MNKYNIFYKKKPVVAFNITFLYNKQNYRRAILKKTES